MNSEITTGKLRTKAHIYDLLALQQRNLKTNISKEELESQGFVTVEHNFDLLAAMNDELPQIVALQDDKVVGYALSMPVSFEDKIPELKPMFLMFNGLTYQNKQLSDYSYYVMGQICIEKAVRGLGVFQKLYKEHSMLFGSKFDFIITEVSLNNKRSMRAHQKVGFKTIHEYFDPENNDTWAVVLWDFNT
jgi:hypothetical protein